MVVGARSATPGCRWSWKNSRSDIAFRVQLLPQLRRPGKKRHPGFARRRGGTPHSTHARPSGALPGRLGPDARVRRTVTATQPIAGVHPRPGARIRPPERSTTSVWHRSWGTRETSCVEHAASPDTERVEPDHMAEFRRSTHELPLPDGAARRSVDHDRRVQKGIGLGQRRRQGSRSAGTSVTSRISSFSHCRTFRSNVSYPFPSSCGMQHGWPSGASIPVPMVVWW
jgi:hypothetical protein